MSLSLDESFTAQTYPYRPRLSSHRLQHSDEAHWLTSASPVAKATSFGPPHTPEEVSKTSSDLDHSTMECFTSHQPESESPAFDEVPTQSQPSESFLPHLHPSAFEYTSTWSATYPYQMSPRMYESSGMLLPPPGFGSAYPGVVNPGSPYSTASMYDESPLQSPYMSSHEIAYSGFAGHPPRSTPFDDYDYEDEEDPLGGKPYARLIYEALYQAPGHRMMLRDMYDWFEKNTTKPRESGTNGWQNSIRHNLSMNHAFENDKTQSINSRGEPKKATSVWFLTDNALRNGVQSTTRYRKNGGVRKSGLNRRPDSQRARSGAKGGRAARRAARLRQLEQSPHMSWASPVTPDELGPFHQLVHAANALNECSPTRSNSPPSPYDQYPYTPPSAGSREGFLVHGAHNTKYDGGEGVIGDYPLQDPLFSQTLDNNLEETWFQASQQS